MQAGMEGSNSRVTTKYGPNKVWLEAYSAATNSVIQLTVSTTLDVGLLLQVRMHDILCRESGQACENPLTQRSSVLEASDMAGHETDEN